LVITPEMDAICFFFQAEDGIRDFHVTGVQTCALPIYNFMSNEVLNAIKFRRTVNQNSFTDQDISKEDLLTILEAANAAPTHKRKIGRASCRERVKTSVGAGRGEAKGA